MTTAIDLDVCPHCEGEGGVMEESMEIDGFHVWMITCPTCKGDGRVDTSPCIGCGAPTYDHDEGCPVVGEEVRA